MCPHVPYDLQLKHKRQTQQHSNSSSKHQVQLDWLLKAVKGQVASWGTAYMRSWTRAQWKDKGRECGRIISNVNAILSKWLLIHCIPSDGWAAVFHRDQSCQYTESSYDIWRGSGASGFPREFSLSNSGLTLSLSNSTGMWGRSVYACSKRCTQSDEGPALSNWMYWFIHGQRTPFRNQSVDLDCDRIGW